MMKTLQTETGVSPPHFLELPVLTAPLQLLGVVLTTGFLVLYNSLMCWTPGKFEMNQVFIDWQKGAKNEFQKKNFALKDFLAALAALHIPTIKSVSRQNSVISILGSKFTYLLFQEHWEKKGNDSSSSLSLLVFCLVYSFHFFLGMANLVFSSFYCFILLYYFACFLVDVLLSWSGVLGVFPF